MPTAGNVADASLAHAFRRCRAVKATQRRGGVAVSHILGGLRQAFDDDSPASSPQRPATMGEQHGAVRVVPIVKHVLEMHRVEAARSILEGIAENEGDPVRKVGF